MSNFLKVQGHDALVRDKETGAILNTDRSRIQALVKKREERHQLEKRVEMLEKSNSEMNHKLDLLLNILTKQRNV